MRKAVSSGALLVLYLTQPLRLLAHSGEPPAPHDLWQSWPWEPWVMITILVGALFYGRGVYTLWQRAGMGRGVHWPRIVTFALGLVTIAAALLTPLATISEALFSVHMVQHILLMNVAAPLLIWGMEPTLFLWALPRRGRLGVARWWQQQQKLRHAWQWLNRPTIVWALYASTLWLWHVPRLYQAALRSETIHLLEHSGFMASALLFWWVLGQGQRRPMHFTIALLFLFTTALHSGLLAAIITFAQRPLYPIYAPYVQAWGLTVLTDQQLAGVIMWVPVGFVYLAALLRRLWIQLATMEREQESYLYE